MRTSATAVQLGAGADARWARAAQRQIVGRTRGADTTRQEAQEFAEQWAAAWNELAVERVLAHFDDRVAFTSPTAVAVVGMPTVNGKQALRDYWNKAVERVGSVKFVVDRVLWDEASRELAIIYVADLGGRKRRVSENLKFGADGRVVSAEVFHGVDV